MAAATEAPDLVEQAKSAQKEAQEALKGARADLKKARTAATKAKAEVKGKEGDELKQAEADAKAADATVDAAQATVAEAEQAVASAKEGVTTARAEEKRIKAEERANRPKKAPLTLSQRRALLNLGDAGKKGIVPKTAFNALPLEHLVSVGLAEKFESTREVEVKVKGEGDKPDTTKTEKQPADGYRLTDGGRERVKEINPKWKDWKPEGTGSSTDGDAS